MCSNQQNKLINEERIFKSYELLRKKKGKYDLSQENKFPPVFPEEAQTLDILDKN